MERAAHPVVAAQVSCKFGPRGGRQCPTTWFSGGRRSRVPPRRSIRTAASAAASRWMTSANSPRRRSTPRSRPSFRT
ncbi:hypothetical protein C1280_19115 [Gemmata obscuriglobus]|uniref:Uncharacterized protein n=1 Tax=Gemmata obscuriglobus TaxID=114 RepID=A0A2Z3H5Q3_9BACT|nr:hypothetical protein C1280_19115 [Gemmata obscuriglobus]